MLESIAEIDIMILEFIQNHLRNSVYDNLMIFFTKLGDHGLIWFAVCLSLLISKRYRRIGIMVAGVLLLETILCEGIIKNVVQRLRPFNDYTGMELLVPKPVTFSFPSGHTASAFSVAGVLLYTTRKFGIPAMILAALIAFSRIYLYVHYPSDVVSGVILGLLCAGIVILVSRKYFGYRTNSKA